MNTERSATLTGTDSDTFVSKLRASTLPAHKQLESLPISEAIISPDLTTSTYIKYLSLMSTVIRDIEEHIFPLVSDMIPDLENRRKHHLIKADLEHLGNPGTWTSLPFNIEGYKATPAFAMGVMYVIEGSTLGGRVILKNVEKALGSDITNATRYFSGYGEQTGSSWRLFLERFTDFAVANKDKQEEMIAGADYTFTAIHDLLKQHS